MATGDAVRRWRELVVQCELLELHQEGWLRGPGGSAASRVGCLSSSPEV